MDVLAYGDHRIPEKLRNIDLTVYEKNEEVGGVWFLNKYPGLACDIPCKCLTPPRMAENKWLI